MIQWLKNYLWHLPKAVFFSAWYGWPARKLTIIGVTGTKGKTTTAHMIYHILRFAPLKSNLPEAKVRLCVAGLISTVGAFFENEEIDTGLHVTSPGPQHLQALLSRAVKQGLTHMVLEVTSSGLDQFRVWGIPFAVSVVTNIAPDHLDYHKTMDRYIEAKARIFSQSKAIVLDRKSSYFRILKRNNHNGLQVLTFDADTISPLSSNEEAAVAAAKALGISETAARKALKKFVGVPGRFEVIYDRKFKVVIDFAHTPESLEAALSQLKTGIKEGGRLIAMFGCAGERDPGRRRMGEVAARLADVFVITAEDPRTESVEKISEEIAQWAKKAKAKELPSSEFTARALTQQHAFTRIPDRFKAITAAISLAKEGDVVGLFGKGHEKSMCFGREEKPWSEHEAVNEALKKRQTYKKPN